VLELTIPVVDPGWKLPVSGLPGGMNHCIRRPEKMMNLSVRFPGDFIFDTLTL